MCRAGHGWPEWRWCPATHPEFIVTAPAAASPRSARTRMALSLAPAVWRMSVRGRGSLPKRCGVAAVWAWTAGVLDERSTKFGPRLAIPGSRALWPSERGPRVGPHRINSRFATSRDASSLDSTSPGEDVLRHPSAGRSRAFEQDCGAPSRTGTRNARSLSSRGGSIGTRTGAWSGKTRSGPVRPPWRRRVSRSPETAAANVAAVGIGAAGSSIRGAPTERGGLSGPAA